ncbi:MAG: HAD family acid phosphatase [Acetobacteraceae bacterium]
MRSWLAALVAINLAACSAPYISADSQPANVGDAKIAALKYHESGDYDRDLAAAAGLAERWIIETAPGAHRPALVLDIDETALSNWPIIVRDDFGRPIGGPCDLASDGPCGWAAWDQLGVSEPILPTLSLFRRARSLDIEVFFITGRPENQRAATERNLRNAGYNGYKSLFMVPAGSHFASAADFKAPIRARIEADGYTIIANVGDQPSDLSGGNAEKSFLLPDPFYRVP